MLDDVLEYPQVLQNRDSLHRFLRSTYLYSSLSHVDRHQTATYFEPATTALFSSLNSKPIITITINYVQNDSDGGAPHASSRSTSPDAPLYSEVVGGGPVSPRNGTDKSPEPNGDGSSSSIPEHAEHDNEEGSDGDNPEPWITIGSRRRARSLDSDRNIYRLTKVTFEHKKQAKKPVPLTLAQGAAVHAAEKSLLQKQRDLIQKRMNKIQVTPDAQSSSDESDSSRGKSPSAGKKGKITDPRNWGAVNFDANELNIDAQHQTLKNFKAVRDGQKGLDKSKKAQNPINGFEPETDVSRPQKDSKTKKSNKRVKNSKHRAGSEALTDLVENHIRDIVEQWQRKPKKAANCPVPNLAHITRPKKSSKASEQKKRPSSNSSDPSSSSSSSDSSPVSSDIDSEKSDSSSSESESSTNSSSSESSSDSSYHNWRRRHKHSH
ncbi:hypothetical protein GYMLUDRAFT_252512 [Collybiopsis luxurians FD-317 M1]|uniref:Uncharacterized protein n=1 Tax=Collybiopsis luxurians FD-317 M1 TaxID=944289 RepID=A0A0D0B9P7_9AGAR|nr:hypothetical protein GYMLUDRAFT_252512 [Collybiopsis luxurians FD-317 M1]